MDDYIVAYEGNGKLNLPIEEVLSNLVSTLRLNQEQAHKLINGPKKVLKKNLSEAEAQRYQAAFGRLGLQTKVESPSTPEPKPELTLETIDEAPSQSSKAALAQEAIAQLDAKARNESVKRQFLSIPPVTDLLMGALGLGLLAFYNPINDGIIRNGFVSGLVILSVLILKKVFKR